MVSGIQGPDGHNPAQESNPPKSPQTGMTKMYTAAKAPGFAQMLNQWFPGQVTPRIVTTFEHSVVQMISNSINRAKQQHKKVHEEIQRRIKEG